MNVLGLGLPELIVIALVLLLFFGSSRLPGLFRSIGTSIKELKQGLQVDDSKTNVTTNSSNEPHQNTTQLNQFESRGNTDNS